MDDLPPVPYRLLPPHGGLSPVVLSSPHSGRLYPPDLVAALRLPPAELRGLEDGPVDRLAEAACEVGGTLIAAIYPRAYVDLNRDPAELDPEIVGNTPGDYRLSAKVRAGLGVIPTRLGGAALYARCLAPAAVERRLRLGYRPYHDQLAQLTAERRRAYGKALLLDCHSMPTPPHGEPRVDVAIGDRFGRTAHPELVRHVHETFEAQGLCVARNRPYAGGFITEHYGRPWDGVSAMQLEFRRALFMDEMSHEPHPGLAALAELLQGLVRDLGRIVLGLGAPRIVKPVALSA